MNFPNKEFLRIIKEVPGFMTRLWLLFSLWGPPERVPWPSSERATCARLPEVAQRGVRRCLVAHTASPGAPACTPGPGLGLAWLGLGLASLKLSGWISVGFRLAFGLDLT